MQRIYFDNAATSWPKPDCVYDAVDHYLRECGAPAGRSAYDEALEAGAAVASARRNIARLVNAESAERVVFAFNGTDALNMAIHGCLGRADQARPQVITSVAEHNSVLRPLRALSDLGLVHPIYVPCDSTGVVQVDAIRRAIRPNTAMIILTHASNVTGALQPVVEVGQLARQHDIPFLLDAAQSLGDVVIDVQALQVDMLAAPGHKGLLGPLGTGVLYIRPGLEANLQPLRQGGTGSQSENEEQPQKLPDRYEAGNHNMPGLVGLEASTRWLLERGVDQVREHQQALTHQLLAGLSAIDGITVYGPKTAAARVGVVSIQVDGFECQELASGLEASYRIQTRAGLHCAPRMHESLGSLSHGGTLRISFGAFNTPEQVDALLQALQESQ